jgi:hypothetical protein
MFGASARDASSNKSRKDNRIATPTDNGYTLQPSSNKPVTRIRPVGTPTAGYPRGDPALGLELSSKLIDSMQKNQFVNELREDEIDGQLPKLKKVFLNGAEVPNWMMIKRDFAQQKNLYREVDETKEELEDFKNRDEFSRFEEVLKNKIAESQAINDKLSSQNFSHQPRSWRILNLYKELRLRKTPNCVKKYHLIDREKQYSMRRILS